MITWEQILLRLAIAAALGSFIGIEREMRKGAAGIRTHMMVSVGACLFMIVSSFGFFDILGTENVELDPSRIAAQVVSGIGFIGAGTILFQQRGIVRGLTTAAGLWTVAAIGLASGGGMFFAATAATIIALLILWALRPIERLYFKKFGGTTLKIVTNSDTGYISEVQNLMFDTHLNILSYKLIREADDFTFYFNFEKSQDIKLDNILQRLEDRSVIKEIYWTK